MTSSYTQNIKWRTYYWQYYLTDIYSRKILISPGTASTWNRSTSERITASSSTVSQTTRFPTIPGTGARNCGGKTNGETWVRNSMDSLQSSKLCNLSVDRLPALRESVWGRAGWPVPGGLQVSETDSRRRGQGQWLPLERLCGHSGLKRICKYRNRTFFEFLNFTKKNSCDHVINLTY